MPAPKINLRLERNTSFRKSFTRKVGKPPQAMNLTEFTVEAGIYSEWEGTLLLFMTPANGRLMITPLAGRTDMILSAADMTVEWQFGVYDIKATSPLGEVIRISRGYVSVQPYGVP